MVSGTQPETTLPRVTLGELIFHLFHLKSSRQLGGGGGGEELSHLGR